MNLSSAVTSIGLARKVPRAESVLLRIGVQRAIWWTLVGIATAGYALRIAPRIARPALWGEDSGVFLYGGWDGNAILRIFDPYSGYLHIVPRFLVAIWRPFPLTWQPGLYATSAAILGFAIMTTVLLPGLAWVLPTRVHRALLFTLLAFAPGRTEVTDNIANLIFVGGIALLFVGLSDDVGLRKIAVIEFVVVFASGLSGPMCLVLAPIFLARSWRNRSRHSYLLAGSVVACGVVQLCMLLFSERDPVQSGKIGNTLNFLRLRILPTWLIGDDGPEWARGSRTPVGVLVSLLAVLLLICLWRGIGRISRATMLAVTVTALGAMILPAYAYAGIIEAGFAPRHLVLPITLIAFLLVSSLTLRLSATCCAAATCILLGIGGMWNDFEIPALPNSPLGGTAQCMTAAKTQYCVVPAQPPAFSTMLFP